MRFAKFKARFVAANARRYARKAARMLVRLRAMAPTFRFSPSLFRRTALAALVLAVPAALLVAAAQIQQYEGNGIIDMDGERFAPANPNDAC